MILLVVFQSCDKQSSIAQELSTKKIRSIDGDLINIIVIDGCEYITWRHYEGPNNSYSSGIVHKENCKNHIKG
jgi:hypothetical protein